MIPSRVAFALQADGWWLRQEITWCKPNGMPSSVEDRPSSATEKVFLLSKSARYFYDNLAVKMPPADASISRWNQYLEGQRGSDRANAGGKTNGPMKAVGGSSRKDKQRGHSRRHAGFNDRWDAMTKEEQQANGANLKNWWVIPTARSSEQHYAMMPDALARICILAGSRPGDVILDPFGGSGTTAKVALELGRKPVHIDLTYHELARKRMTTTPAMAGLMG
jgi:DNA modification methylase